MQESQPDCVSFEERLRQNYDSLQDPKVLAEVEHFFRMNPNPVQSGISTVAMKLITKVASHGIAAALANQPDIALKSDVIPTVRAYCHEAIRLADYEISEENKYQMRKMQGHLYGYAAQFALHAACQMGKGEERLALLRVAYDEAGIAIHICSELKDLERTSGIHAMRAGIAKRLAFYGPEKRTWLFRAIQDLYTAANIKQKFNKSFAAREYVQTAEMWYDAALLAETEEDRHKFCANALQAIEAAHNLCDTTDHVMASCRYSMAGIAKQLYNITRNKQYARQSVEHFKAAELYYSKNEASDTDNRRQKALTAIRMFRKLRRK
jgi:hypothetical protein